MTYTRAILRFTETNGKELGEDYIYNRIISTMQVSKMETYKIKSLA